MTPEQIAAIQAETLERAAKWHDEQVKMLTDAFDNSNSLASSFAYRAVPFHEQAAAALRALKLPTDWVVVPREPTEAMIEAGIEAARIHNEYGEDLYLKNPADVYRAMLTNSEKAE